MLSTETINYANKFLCESPLVNYNPYTKDEWDGGDLCKLSTLRYSWRNLN